VVLQGSQRVELPVAVQWEPGLELPSILVANSREDSVHLRTC
jgi:hypothetical protein